ncbi:MAG TPA: hypothetical protein VJA94_15160 [Candidatus Angelobacter sp.]
MKRSLLLLLLLAGPIVATAQTEPFGFLDPQNAPRANAREDELYSSAKDALDNNNYDKAISGFDEVAKLKGRRADAALYWKSYALDKAGRHAEAQATIEQLKREYPQSSWLRNAKSGGLAPKPGTGGEAGAADEEEKEYALQACINMPPERCVPILEKVLQGNSSLKLKKRALFVLSQVDSDKAGQLLLVVAKGSMSPELQKEAIRMLAISGARNGKVLKEIYLSTTDAEVKKSVLRSFIINGDKEDLMDIIRQEKSPELRREGIRQLGPMGAHAEIRQLYKESNDVDTKEILLQAMGVAGDAQGLLEIAKTETNPDIRARAIRNVGIFGGDGASDALLSIYNSSSDVETKKQVIRALFVHGAAKQMVDLARKETNPELKKELVRNLSIMQSPEATEYMMEILNK